MSEAKSIMASNLRHVCAATRNVILWSVANRIVARPKLTVYPVLAQVLKPHLDATKRNFSSSSVFFQEEDAEDVSVEEEVSTGQIRPVHDVETSKRYIESKAYAITYGDEAVWVPYRRNHKGLHPPEKTRKSCMRQGVISTGNPCPICRDEYLVLHPKNTRLLEQFISPYTGEVLSFKKTGLCQTQHKNLLVAVAQAWDTGYIEKALPHREYDYSAYYAQLKS